MSIPNPGIHPKYVKQYSSAYQQNVYLYENTVCLIELFWFHALLVF